MFVFHHYSLGPWPIVVVNSSDSSGVEQESVLALRAAPL